MQSSKILLFCLPFLFTLRVQAQSPDNFLLQIGSPDSSEYASAILPDENEDLYVASTVFHKIRRRQQLKIDKISKSGRVLWSKRYSGNTRNMFSILKQPDKTLILAGGFQDTMGNWPSEGSALLMKTDAVGNPIWEKSYKFGDRGSIYELFQTEGGYILHGSGYSERPTGLELDFFLYEVDFAGTVLWKKEFPMKGDQGGLIITPLKSGNFCCVLGRTATPTRIFTLTPAGEVVQEINVSDADITSISEKENGQLIFFKTERVEQDGNSAAYITYAKTLQADSLVMLKKLTYENLRSGFTYTAGHFYTSYGYKNKVTMVKMSPDFEVIAEAPLDLPEYASMDGFLITDQQALVVMSVLALPLEHVDPGTKSKNNYDMLIKKIGLNSVFKN